MKGLPTTQPQPAATDSEKQSVHFAQRDTMMSSRSPIASNLHCCKSTA
jgi:hypothetical protein